MEINRCDVEIEDELPGLISVCVKRENQESESNDESDITINEPHNYSSIEIKEANNNCLIEELQSSIIDNNETDDLGNISLTFNSLESENVAQQQNNNSINDIIISEPQITLGNLHPDIINEEIQRRMRQATEIFINNEEKIDNLSNSYNVTDFLQFDQVKTFDVEREKRNQEWLCLNKEPERQEEEDEGEQSEDLNNSCNNSSLDSFDLLKINNNNNNNNNNNIENQSNENRRIEEEVSLDIVESGKRKGRTRLGCEKLKRRLSRRKIKPRQDYRERLRRKAECMREKRKKLYEKETEEERLDRLAKEAAKRREMRMYYETPEQRRKRLDAEAARKREYRMYNETPEERRKRLDREAERRRIKRLTLYANETAEQRRERLNKESGKRREARLNQYSKETEDQRRERLRKDALRAREMRFTRSAIETEEERRERLVKDALRKRELRNNCAGNTMSNFTELQNVRSFEELNNVQMRDDPDNQLGSHYLSNWMMWFQNTLTQPVHIGEQTIEPQSQNNG